MFVRVVEASPGWAAPPGPVMLAYFTADEVEKERRALDDPTAAPVARMPAWQLREQFGYVRADLLLKVPVHEGSVAWELNRTDLATVPPALWGLLAPYGQQMRPALLHDHFCDHLDMLPTGVVTEGASDFRRRRATDLLFRDGLRDEGVGWIRRHLFWAGVSLGRGFGYRRVATLLLCLLVLLSLVVELHWLYAALGLPTWTPGTLGRIQWIAVIVLVGVTVLLGVLRWFEEAAVLVVTVVAVAACSLRPDWDWVQQVPAHGTVLLVIVAATVLVGCRVNVWVALISLVVAPIVVPVLVVSSLAETVLVLPDALTWQEDTDHPVRPQPRPTMTAWRT